jgi:phosphohistidine phosphatase
MRRPARKPEVLYNLGMRRLHVLRHAKSSWDDPSLRDHDRPLAPRGRKAAKKIARHLRDEGIDPDLVLCSTALRARQTLEGIEPALGRRRVSVEPGLYAAGADELLQRLRALDETAGSVMLIGHNPGLQDLVVELAAPGPERDAVAAKLPTAALASLAVREPWPELRTGGAQLVGFVRPRDL